VSLLLGALCACQIAAATPEANVARTAGELLARARAARYQQDSALQDYQAMAKQRWTAKLGVAPGLGLGPVSRLRLGARLETVARVGWNHQYGAWAELIGARAVAPIVGEVEPEIVDDEFAITLPYHPGRDRLWPTDELVEALPGRDGLFAHPLDPANDSLYRFALGEPVDITLPGGRRIGLRELLVRPVRPDGRLIVGSLWVDASSGALVRAAYRPSVPVDLWPYMEPNFDGDERDIIRRFAPFEGKVEEILVEHGLYEERFWLPRVRIVHAEGTAKGARVTMSIEQTFDYERVRALPPGVAQARQPSRDSLRRWGDDTGRPEYRDLEYIGDGRYDRRRVRTCRESGDTTSAALSPDSLMRSGALRTESTVEGLRVRVLLPCDLGSLIDSPTLPPSIYSPSEELFTETDLASVRREVQQALAISSQADWSPQPTKLRYGFDRGLLRYNRVEGLSAGIAAERELGRGYSGEAVLRLGTGDLEPNVELTMRRSNGHRDLYLAGYRRLEAANAWGNPLGFASSLNALLLGTDNGFYHRATGAELGGSHRRISGSSAFSWRLFSEQHASAEVGTTFSLARVAGGADFAPNPPALEGTYSGGAAVISFGFGTDPRGTQLSGSTQVEAADGAASYGRGSLELRMAQGFGRSTTLSITGAAGSSLGELPPQRHWYLGGAHTIHAHRPGAASGDGFWFARAELTRGMPLIRPILFADLGWAGDRRDWLTSRERLWAAGIGGAALDGLLRFDISRALDGSRRWTLDVFLELR
jgi:hypothetical protein